MAPPTVRKPCSRRFRNPKTTSRWTAKSSLKNVAWMEGREGSTPSIQATFFSMQLNNQSRSNFSYHKETFQSRCETAAQSGEKRPCIAHDETYPHKQKSPKAYGIRLWAKKQARWFCIKTIVLICGWNDIKDFAIKCIANLVTRLQIQNFLYSLAFSRKILT